MGSAFYGRLKWDGMGQRSFREAEVEIAISFGTQMAKEIHHCLNQKLSSQSIYLGPLMILD